MQNQEERIKFLLLCYHKSPELRCSAGATVQVIIPKQSIGGVFKSKFPLLGQKWLH